jgi:hypothetical protein
MSETSPQSHKTHARFDPPYHYFLVTLSIANLVVAIVHLVHHVGDFDAWWLVVLSLAFIVLIYRTRTYPLKVQDRVIRLEERIRLQALAPAEWHKQIYNLSEDQLIGLRFAGDDEVVTLAELALEKNLTRKQIKERIKSWRADNWRV